MKITDLHTHRLRHDAIVAAEPEETLIDGYVYSVGIHPWHTDTQTDFRLLLEKCSDPRVVAIGECGLDSLTDTPMPVQEEIFLRHIEISEQLRKPMIIHCVRAHERLLAIRRTVAPTQPWAIHGFRQKPTVAARLMNAGLYLSLGPRFNPETARLIPDDRLLIETDDDPSATIRTVAEAVAEARTADSARILSLSAATIARILPLP